MQHIDYEKHTAERQHDHEPEGDGVEFVGRLLIFASVVVAVLGTLALHP